MLKINPYKKLQNKVDCMAMGSTFEFNGDIFLVLANTVINLNTCTVSDNVWGSNQKDIRMVDLEVNVKLC